MAEPPTPDPTNQPDVTQPEKRVRLNFDPEEYTLRKRLPRSFPRRDIDVYISRKTNFVQQLEKCKKLLQGEHEEVVIHGLGAAVNRAINLALQVKAVYGDTVELATMTSTEELIDDLEPQVDNCEPMSQGRNTSAVHIRIYKTGSHNVTT